MAVTNCASSDRDPDRAILLDVTRLVWRAWVGRRPTGIDRVCLAYLERFGGGSRAVIRRKGFSLILSTRHSDRLAQSLLSGRAAKATILRLLVPGLWNGPARLSVADAFYLNVGHTGLDDPGLQRWIARHRLRAVYMVHDIIPMTHPQYCRAGQAEKHRRRIGTMLASAHGIIGNSHDTMEKLARFADCEAAGLPPSIVAPLASESLSRNHQPSHARRPYFVVVGTIEARKNHALLLKVWDQLLQRLGPDAPELVIIGQRGWEAEETLRKLDNLETLAGYVREINGCNDDQLAAWLAGARALLMPSFAEGFGLPVVEALAIGTPVIASDLPVFRETVGDIPTYLDPRDMDAWRESIEDFIKDGPERQRQQRQIGEFQPSTWDDHFDVVEQWLATM